MVCGRVDVATGTPTRGAGEGFSIVDVAPGQVRVVFDRPGRSIVSVAATPLEGTDATSHAVKIDAKVEASSVTFATYAAGALADNIPFYFQIILKDAG